MCLSRCVVLSHCMYLPLYMCAYVCMYVCVLMCVCVCVCVCVCERVRGREYQCPPTRALSDHSGHPMRGSHPLPRTAHPGICAPVPVCPAHTDASHNYL